ncbi:conserved hypothetical protein [Candidatus Nitrotoga sp. HW29]|uniref:retron St85 family effector protein n=1 Tax=Candidatus Nitrotoga sp. HW29 TaxID=2886963 RepID=UPI001EF2F78E|nr:retron St85 family effector protein [Candidatus Nitrotoga sp. HW29]CAH1905834.1 conserved hypothetical protein [Candidatus Nitrotoga sp. HW29]
MTLKAINEFILTVAPDKATVISFPEFIAIFGSSISLKRRCAKPKSKRDAFYWWLLDKRPDLKELLLVPESYNDWNDSSVYSDLLLFEKDLGFLTSAVLIFLESPGSIAELGAFSQITSLSERLLVVVTENYHPTKSFISFGPLRSIQETQNHSNCICVIPELRPERLVDHVHVIIEMLDKKILSIKSKKERFDVSNLQHQIILILDFINLFSVLNKSELQLLASHFLVDMKYPRLNQLLFLLEKIRLISRKHYGGIEYYQPLNFKDEYVDYTSCVAASPYNRATTIARAWDEIKNDPYRKSLLNSSRKAGAKK